MTEVAFAVGAAFGVQSVRGTANSTIAALSGALGVADGIVLGDPSGGVGESGVTLATARRLREKARISGSFTRAPSDFLEHVIDSFEIVIPLKGNGATATPAAGEAKPDAGIDALWQAVGWTGANGTNPVYEYTPASAQIITAKVWFAGLAWILKDLVGDWVISATPGEIATLTCTLSGKIDGTPAAATFPTFTYGNQSSLSAPNVETTGHNWGISAEVRSFTAMEITGTNSIDEIPDSEASGGLRPVQTDRQIDIASTVFLSDTDLDFEIGQLLLTVEPTDQMDFRLGTAAGATDTINGVLMEVTNPEARLTALEKQGDNAAYAYELTAVDGVANNEMKITYD